MVVLSFTAVITSNAQQAPDHDKRIYRAEDGKLYINKDLPVYVRIASSPDEDAESWLLKSEKTEEYTNPMYLDTEGWNSLRSPSAVDSATRETAVPIQDVVFDMYADGLAPSTNLQYGTSEFFENDGIIFFGNDIDLEFDASDEMSGIEDVYYSINGKDYQPAGEYPLDITEEGEYKLKFYAVDNVGNVEEPQTFRFTIDETPPATEHQVEGLKDDKVLSPDATISLTGDDNLSGVDEIYYAIDDNEFRKYENPIPVSVLQNTKGRITYYATDHTGNKEEPNHIGTMASSDKKSEDEEGETFDYYIDREPPKPELTFEGDYYEGDRDYISERTKIVLEATDDKSGVKEILYSYNGFITEEEYDSPFHPEGNSPVELLYTAIDKADNRAKEKSREFYIDRAAPESELSFDGPVFNNRDTTFISGQTKIVLDARDEESGVKNIQFRLNDQEE
ncbi:MAG: OmpL47-type beta-barrel domain-containing protein, partial [Marinilabiliaceae bacterium]